MRIKIRKDAPDRELEAELWKLYQQNFLDNRHYFRHDLAESTYLAIYTTQHKTIGFTGISISHASINQQAHVLVYLRPMIIDSAYRGNSLVCLTLAKLSLMLWREFRQAKVYVWTNALTYQSYLVLAKGMKEMYPSKTAPASSSIRQVIDHIGYAHYPDHYQAQQGTVNMRAMWLQLTQPVIPQKFKGDQDIEFFTQYNPGYQDGSSLITLAPLNQRNLTGLMKRYLRWRLGMSHQPNKISPVRFRGKYPLSLAI